MPLPWLVPRHRANENSPRSHAGIADGLEVNGGIVLLVGGAALIGLACLFASEPTVAPVFAVFGPAMLILGAFYARIEGSVEATREGIKATVRALHRRASEQNLSPDIADEALERALRSRSYPSREWTDSMAEAKAERAISEVRDEHNRIVEVVARWLERDGYEVREQAGGFDLIGVKGDSAVGVEVKVSRHVSVAAVRQVASFPLPSNASAARPRRILVVTSHSRISVAAWADAVHAGVELMTVDSGGNVVPLSPSRRDEQA